MAARPKRSKQKLNPFVEHGEKIALGLLVAVLGWVVDGALVHPTYEKKPEELKQAANSKLTAIQTAAPDATFAEQFPEEDFANKVQQANQPIAPAEYALATPIHFDGATGLGDKRIQPELLPLDEVSARFVRMSLAISPSAENLAGGPGGVRRPGAGGLEGEALPPVRRPINIEGGPKTTPGVSAPQGSIPRGPMAIVVVGRVPVSEQVALYQKAFRDSRFKDSVRDLPEYVSFLIERADVTDSEQNPKWSAVTGQNQPLILANLAEVKTWAVEAPEIVEPQNVRRLQLNAATGFWEGFTFPLPPRLLEDWGSEVTCKSIKKIDPLAAPGIPGEATPGQTPPAPVPGGNPFTNPPPANPFQNPPMGAPFNPGANIRRPGGQRFVAQQPSGGFRPPGVMGTPNFRDAEMEGFGPSGTGQAVANPSILFRFFDFHLEPNRRYQYRVQLVLKNPNFELPERYLQTADLGKSPYIMSPFSDPTPAVGMTGFSEVLAGPVKPASGIVDASATIIIRNRDPETGATVAFEFPGLKRGTLLNYIEKKTTQRVRGGGTKDTGPLKPNPVDGSVTIADEAKFQSNELLLDILGGENIPGSPTNRVTEPSGVLVLDQDGRLDVRGALADQVTDFDDAKKRLEELANLLAPEKTGEDIGQPQQNGNGLGGRVGGTDP